MLVLVGGGLMKKAGRPRTRQRAQTWGLLRGRVTSFLDPTAFTAPVKDYGDRFVWIGLSRKIVAVLGGPEDLTAFLESLA